MKIKFSGLALTLLAAGMLSGCLGGGESSDDDSGAHSTISGVAATGTPFVNATINIRCATGNALSATTDSAGAWQATLAGQTLPCALQVNGGTVNGAANLLTYHSIISTLAFPTNVTPLTDLIVANLAGTAILDVWFDGLSTSPAALASLTQGDVDAALAKLRAALSGLPPLATNSPLNMALTATPGDVGDDMLTALAVAMANTGVTYMALLGNAAMPAFTPPVTGFDTALTTAYAATISGGGTAP